MVVILRGDGNGVTVVENRFTLAGAASAFFVVTSDLRSIEDALKGGGEGEGAAFCFAGDLGKFMESSFEVTEELGSLFFIELFLGWHLMVLNAIEDVAPAGEGGAFRRIELEGLEIEHAFFVKGVVALVAIVVEELDNGASELVLWVFLCSEGSEKEKRGSDS